MTLATFNLIIHDFCLLHSGKVFVFHLEINITSSCLELPIEYKLAPLFGIKLTEQSNRMQLKPNKY